MDAFLDEFASELITLENRASSREEPKSIAIASNQPFSGWTRTVTPTPASARR